MKSFEFENLTILFFRHAQFCINENTSVKSNNCSCEFFIGYKRACYRPIVIAPTNIALETTEMSH